MCLPSWTTTATPLKFPATNAPATVDSYACYSVVHPKLTSAFALPAKVRLKDQFGERPGSSDRREPVVCAHVEDADHLGAATGLRRSGPLRGLLRGVVDEQERVARPSTTAISSVSAR